MTVTSVEPSAPPIDDDEIPVVTATAIPVADDQSAFPSASATAFNISDSQSAPATAVPTAPLGMSMVTKTITYPDGRKVTTTEYVPSSIAAPAPAAAAAPNRQHHPPRRDLGSNASSVTCPYCQHTGLTRTNQQCGECTWISAIILVLFCFPLAWIPFVCPSCYDTEHYCRQCGKVIGWSRADCCSKK